MKCSCIRRNQIDGNIISIHQYPGKDGRSNRGYNPVTVWTDNIFDCSEWDKAYSKCRATKPNSIIVRYYNAFLFLFTKTEWGIKKITALVVDKYNFFV